ncbi:hypothetical protein [Deinococcus metallilatus]|uniref:Uncharacterized protein n=1 Tax=Deinococcus metallilatus TaxID=1211322 RepID=A0ABR6MR23_9DEIO|nr:hypothetical protein [Deinococcus metallilatus]MBB5294379.1 hypothetical protein [Deinococcus metallilatus]
MRTMRYEYDARRDSTLHHLEELHADGARERLWRNGASHGEGWAHPLEMLRHLLGR